MTNEAIAQRLLEYARELEKEGGNIYRIRAYRTAAQAVQGLTRPAAEILAEAGRKGLEELPGIGKSLAYTIEGLVLEGKWRTLKPADTQREPDRLFTSLPGVGPKLAEDLHERLGLRTLEELYRAALAGRLHEVGVGHKRLMGLIAALEKRLAPVEPPPNEPSIEALLDLDRDYREGMEQDTLPRLSPRHFNPEGESWLGVLRVERDGWKMRALFSNTAQAHRLGKTHDWVVIYFERGDVRGQRTVVTETRGELAGRRVVRGRESECRLLSLAEPVASEPAA
jgi:putative hydrolase